MAAPVAGADLAHVERAFLERTAIAAADTACNLFSEGERLALKSGLYQAEGELLRADYTPARLQSLGDEVRAHARALGCDHPSVLEVAGTIRSSYRQFAKTTFMEYVGGGSTWGASRSEHDAWAIMQTLEASGVIVGLRRGEAFDDLTFAVGVPATGRAPSKVQMFLRDAAKMRDPWLGPILGATTLPLAPRSLSRPEWAAEMEEHENSVGDWFYVYSFSPSAIERLELLDPREIVQVELTPSSLNKAAPVKITFPVGDLRAAHAFALIPKPAAATAATSAPGRH
jgi:hypothetical protein